MKTMIRISMLLGVLVLALSFAGCNLFGGNSVTGTATKGPVDAAEVTVYALNDDGTRGTELASGVTSNTGDYSVDIGDFSGPVAVSVVGGSYKDEATGTTVELGSGEEMTAFVASVQNGENAAVTALTTIAAERAAEQAADGLAEAIDSANTETAAAFGLDGIDISTTIPADLSDSESQNAGSSEQAYGAVQAGLSQVADSEGLEAADVLALVDSMAADFASGEFNGLDANGKALQVALSVTPKAAMTGLETAINAFLKSEENLSGLDEVPVTVPEPGVQ